MLNAGRTSTYDSDSLDCMGKLEVLVGRLKLSELRVHMSTIVQYTLVCIDCREPKYNKKLERARPHHDDTITSPSRGPQAFLNEKSRWRDGDISQHQAANLSVGG